jgi:hypothetical protein
MRIARFLSLLILILATACGSRPTPLPPTATALPPTATPTPAPSATPSLVLQVDDFEAVATDWKAGTGDIFTDSSSVSVALTGEHVSQGKQALQLAFKKTDQPKAIFFLDRPLDLSGGRYLQFDLYDPGMLSGAGIALTTGAGAVWFESDSLPVEAGQPVTLTFDLTAATYKTAGTNWEFRANIADRSAVQRLAIILAPARDGSVVLDNVRLSGAP